MKILPPTLTLHPAGVKGIFWIGEGGDIPGWSEGDILVYEFSFSGLRGWRAQ